MIINYEIQIKINIGSSVNIPSFVPFNPMGSYVIRIYEHHSGTWAEHSGTNELDCS